MIGGAFHSSIGPRLLRYALIGTLATPQVAAYVEMEFAGQGQGWTDVTGDVAFLNGWDIDRGLPGITATDRCAKTGTWKFEMRNDANNSGGVVGYYSPDSPNCRPNFSLGIGVRLVMNIQGEKHTVFIGELDEIDPAAGLFNGLRVPCVAVDEMDRAAKTPMGGVPVQQNKRSDQVFSAITAILPRQPRSLQVQVGLDTYPIALDTTYDGTTTVLTEYQSLAMSELGLIFTKADGTLVFESRKTRPTTLGIVDTFLDTEVVALSPTRSRASVINRVQTTVYPRSVDAAPTSVLFILNTVTSIGPGEIQVIGPAAYRDPTNKASSVGGLNMQAPVATTDYAMNAATDGSGADLTAFMTVSALFSGNSVTFTIQNTSNQTAFFGGNTSATKLQCRGQGIYPYASVVLDQQDPLSRDLYGLGMLQIDMPYQNDPAVGNEVSFYLLNLQKNPLTQIPVVTVFADHNNPARWLRIVRRDISDRIAIVETVSGLGASRSYFINAVKMHIDTQLNVSCSFALAPADATAYWLLEIVGSSELDQTTRLGYGLIVGHIDVAHADVHDDVAHGDVSHGDTNHADAAHADQHNDSAHSDSVHVDTAHVDTPHGDGHTDAAHADTAHSDVAHADSHSDSPHNDSHSDTAHADAHDDIHTDAAHNDSAHTDVAHTDFNDVSHDDHDDVLLHDDNESFSHGDAAHFDNAHGDVAHGDVAHVDDHSDVTHIDTHVDSAHGDATSSTAHSDVAHVDGSHADNHSDSSHVDTAHVDTAHGDGGHADSHDDTVHGDTVHSDSPHTDVVHADDHSDTAHGDV